MEQIVRKRSLAEVVAEKIREQIREGRYTVDDKLPTEPELMETFGVGRSTVREAVKILAHSGFLRVKQGLGTFVKRLHASEPLENRLERADVEDLVEVRELLELKIVEKTALHRSPDHLAKMRSALTMRKDFAGKGMTKECIAADIDFHLAVAEGCGNEILLDLYRSVSRHVSKLFRKRFTNTLKFQETQELHEELLRHIQAEDPKKALAAAERIIGQI
ncbi:DNA-binding FadR family transcriptional regulator [Anseongella ginsenosidimutans]|uniref:DNA-binding FadR family transcriptional regulator n=1 Tax=Anseongella ginsenosidimutans TaxID=496056 RepID=A0A4R3KR60_9SPHI|nr:FadR/GntR family transcriptional regulator [Anseongella ginsenosidimutans]QEC53001.1 FadR family transcriptional regulator [Anseongella ginsenosidimutans]TCS87408.1 DNA-binding FadR family transcriptional regulator [Anseongella ginsenosidimutans]